MSVRPVIVRLAVIVVLIASAAAVMAVAQTRHQVLDSASYERQSSVDSNFYLNEALKSLESGDLAKVENATKSLSIALQLDPANPHALKLYQTLEVTNSREINTQIDNTVAIIAERPDYAAAWLRLSILYKQLGNDELSEKALKGAQALNISW